MIKNIIVSLLFLTILHAGSNAEESGLNSDLMSGNFSEIQRFKA